MAAQRVTWEEAKAMAKRSPSRGFMPPASAIEIVLPDIGGTYADIQRFACVPWKVRDAYRRARGEAFAYGGDERREKAEDLLDAVLTAEALRCPHCEGQLGPLQRPESGGDEWRECENCGNNIYPAQSIA